MKKLSILICTLKRRKMFLERLFSILEPQLNSEIEVISACDEGNYTIGGKRQNLLHKAIGEYICFIDDDDRVSDDYVSLVFNGLDSNPDVLGIHLLMTTDGVLNGKAYHSIKYPEWYEEDSDDPSYKNYFRSPNHLNPVKRELAIKAGFPDSNMGEDHAYSTSLFPLLKSEVYIEQPIYLYEVRTDKKV